MGRVFLLYNRNGLSMGDSSYYYGRMNGCVGGMASTIVRCLMMWDVITFVGVGLLIKFVILNPV